MTCSKCETDLSKCSCPDLEERLKKLIDCKYLHIGPEYHARILANIHKRKQQTTETKKESQ